MDSLFAYFIASLIASSEADTPKKNLWTRGFSPGSPPRHAWRDLLFKRRCPLE